MSTRNAGTKPVETAIYETVCDQCGAVMVTKSPDLGREPIYLSWGLLDCWWGDEFPDLDGHADLCSIACARAFFLRVEGLLADAGVEGFGTTPIGSNGESP